MKAKYIILSVFALAATVACEKEGAHLMSEFQADKLYVTIPNADGTATVKVTATEEWSFDYDIKKDTTVLDAEKKTKKKSIDVNQLEEYSWVEISPASGKAGETTITFKDNRKAYFKKINGADPTADDDLGSFNQTFKVKVGDKYQNIVVSVGTPAKAAVVTVKQLRGEDESFTPVDGKTYRITGTCTNVYNTTYGNWYLKDDTSDKTITIYGTVDATGAYNWSAIGIESGDIVTVEGPFTLYNGTTPELVDVSVLKIEKGLLSSVKGTYIYIPKDNTPFEIELQQKGTGIGAESQTDWLTLGKAYTVNKKGNVVYTVTPEENTTGAARTGTIFFTSNTTTKDKDGKDVLSTSEMTITITQQADFAKGTLKDIRDLCAQKKAFDIELTKPVTVTLASGSYMFVEDGEVGLTLYNSSDKYSVGQKISGRVFGKSSVYNNVPQATGFNSAMGKAEAAPTDPTKLPKGTEVTLQKVIDEWDTWAYRLITIKGLSVKDEIKATYPVSTGDDERHPKYDDKGKEVTETGDKEGVVTDGNNEMAIVINSSSFYLNMEVGKKYDVTCVPSFYKNADKQVVKVLGLWSIDHVKEVKAE